MVDEDGEEQHQRLGWGDQWVTEAPGHINTGTPSHQACIGTHYSILSWTFSQWSSSTVV